MRFFWCREMQPLLGLQVKRGLGGIVLSASPTVTGFPVGLQQVQLILTQTHRGCNSSTSTRIMPFVDTLAVLLVSLGRKCSA